MHTEAGNVPEDPLEALSVEIPREQGAERRGALGARGSDSEKIAPHRSVSEVAVRLERILDDAEAAATEIRDRAERELRDRERQLERGIEVLRDGLARLEIERDRLARELNDVLTRLGGNGSGFGEGQPAPPADDRAGSHPDSVHSRRRSRESAIIFATQMVVDGMPRRQIEKRLSAEFGIPEPAPIVDEILTRT